MLRVLSLGPGLPQSTFNVGELLRTPLSPWDLLVHTSSSLQVRRISDFAARWPEPPREANKGYQNQMVQDESQPLKRANALNQRVGGWKTPYVYGETPTHSVRPPRLPRSPPKYARPPGGPEGPENNVARTTDITTGVPRVMIHPLHRRPNRKANGRDWDSHLEELFLSEEAPLTLFNSLKPKKRRRDWSLQILSRTKSADTAWRAYNALLADQKSCHLDTRQDGSPLSANERDHAIIPYAYLHRLARLLASTHPRTRELFLRLLSVLTTLRSTGGTIFVWEWNALIDCAGKGWRRTNIEDYRAALGVFRDMVNSGKAAASLSPPTDTSSELGDISPADKRPVARPDIISFTTLLDIASRSLSEGAIIHATSLLDASELPWNHVTHMTRIRYFIRTHQLQGVCDILRNAVHRGLDLSTLNAGLWAYARSGRLLVALEVYELLRLNIPHKDRADLGEVDHPTPLDIENNRNSRSPRDNPILDIPGFAIPPAMRPDRVTYSLLIQALCYHGVFTRAMKVFRDMVSTVDPGSRPMVPHPVGRPPRAAARYYKPSLNIYRAIFLGFARHAHKKPTLASGLVARRRYPDALSLSEFAANLAPRGSDAAVPSPSPPEDQRQEEMPWTLRNLDTLFESFLEMGWEPDHSAGTMTSRPSDRMIYWIMIAYAKTTQRDVAKMYEVWRQLDDRFGYTTDGVSLWGGRLARIAVALEKRHRLTTAQYDSEDIEPNG